MLSKVTDQRGYDREFKYQIDGNLYTYDAYFNRILTQTTAGDPDDYTFAYYGFTGDGNANQVQKVTISKIRDSVTVNNDIDYSYDDLGRLYTRTFKGDTETFNYDELDRLESMSDPLGDFDYGYDGLTGRIQTVQNSVSGVNGLSMALGYDHKIAGGEERRFPNLTSITYGDPSGMIAQHAYQKDVSGLIKLWQQWSEDSVQSFSYRYNEDSQLENAIKHDGLDEQSAPLKRHEYRYDDAGNRVLAYVDGDQSNVEFNDINQLVAQGSEGGTLIHGVIGEPGKVFVQQLDGSGNVTDSQEAALYSGNEFYANLELPVGSNTFRIIAADIFGETTTQDYSLTVASDTGDSFSYDAAGNLTEWIKADGTTVEYHWDAANRLRSIEVDSQLIQSFEYDGADRMVRAINISGQRDDYFWDGLKRLGRESPDGSPTVYQRYLANGFTESLNGAAANKYYTLRDHLGSTREILDDAYNVITRYDYGPWGEVTKLSGSVEADLLYAGHLYYGDADTPIHIAPYRSYSPLLGRWLSRDFLGELGPDGTNVYAYALGNPILYNDPTGLYSVLGLEFDDGKGFWDNVGDYFGSAGSGAAMGAAAYADGFNPFGDPFESAGFYNSDCYGLGASKFLGTVGFTAATTAAGVGIGGRIAARGGFTLSKHVASQVRPWPFGQRYWSETAVRAAFQSGKAYLNTGQGIGKLLTTVRYPIGNGGAIVRNIFTNKIVHYLPKW
ncbi:RHS repeat domain-containing protein [Cerasicoccus fimbriatus]|uniref:RHS repeat domain-containing protein n=1 Tax=Cerasicoccus fimbriatus TaxID=3014554 RepID=UPI0022B4DE02|nr:RHS repeat-associated core domain-containing protein [Cerasicoccus sp. TK19100]